MNDLPTSAAPVTAAGRPIPRRIAMTIVASLVVAGAALGIASLLDDPVGEGPRDQAPIVAGVVTPQGQELTGGNSKLPPLAMVLSRPVPGGIGQLPAEQQVARLREQLASSAGAATGRRYVALGRAYMELGDLSAANDAFSRASRLLPSDPEPLVGLAMARGIGSDQGLTLAAGELESLGQRFPRSQVVVFNEGWLGLYTNDIVSVRRAWRETVRLGPRTPLGRLAASLLARIRTGTG